MENIIDVDGKKYDVTKLSPSAFELVQMTQFAQAEMQRKSLEAKVANIAFQSSFSNLRVALASEPLYMPSPPPEAADPAVPEEGGKPSEVQPN